MCSSHACTQGVAPVASSGDDLLVDGLDIEEDGDLDAELAEIEGLTDGYV